MATQKKSVAKNKKAPTEIKADKLSYFVAYAITGIILLILLALAIRLCIWIINI